MKKISFMLVLVIFCSISKGQNLTLKISDISSPIYSYTIVPVTVENFSDIQSMYIRILWNDNVAHLAGIDNIHPSIYPIACTTNILPGHLFIDWHHLENISIKKDTLFTLKFYYTTKYTPIAFDTMNCYITNAEANYTNGSISSLEDVYIVNNPIKSFLTISNCENTDYIIFDFLGRRVTNQKIENNVIDVSTLPNGLYFLLIQENHSLKFIKQ